MWFRKIVRRPSRYSGITWLSLYSVTKIRQMSTNYLCCQGLEDQASGNYSIRTYVLYEEINFPVKSFLPDSEKQITWNFAGSSNRLWKKRSYVQNSCWTTHTSFYYLQKAVLYRTLPVLVLHHMHYRNMKYWYANPVSLAEESVRKNIKFDGQDFQKWLVALGCA